MTRESWHGEDEPVTRPGTPSSHLRAAQTISSTPPPSGDVLVVVGQLMAAVARLDRKVNDLLPLVHEVYTLRQDLEENRHHLVHDSSKLAARKSSNRMALIVGGLFAAYESAAPVIHELWRVVNAHR